MLALLGRNLTGGALAAVMIGCAQASGPVTSRIYPAPSERLSLERLPAGSRMVEVRTADGLRLQGIVAPGKTDRPLLLLLHGNGSSAATALQWLEPLVADGFGIVSAEYRGYSGNPGKPSEAGLVQDASAFLALARAEAAGRPIWLVGHSLGGGVALSLARRERLDAVITIGTFTRLRDMASGIVRGVLPNEYRNEEAVAALDEPLYIVHGLRDDIVPWRQGEALHKAAGRSKRHGASFVISSAGHQPEAADLRSVLQTILQQRTSGRWNTSLLPQSVALIPFGTSRPLEGVPAP